MNIKAGTWFINEQMNNIYLFRVLDAKNGRYTIREEMYFTAETLTIANDFPVTKLDWDNSSMGIRIASYDIHVCIPMIFKVNKIVFSKLNGSY